MDLEAFDSETSTSESKQKDFLSSKGCPVKHGGAGTCSTSSTVETSRSEASLDSGANTDNTHLPPNIGKKPCIKTFEVEDIHVCTKRASWKVLKQPDLEQVARASIIRRSESMPALLDELEKPSDECTKRESRVSFHNITVREYDLTVGDNPCVSSGPPVSLDWTYSQAETFDIQKYEEHRARNRRHPLMLCLTPIQRKRLLKNNFGESEDEIRKAEKAVVKAQAQRGRTEAMLWTFALEDMLESASRKMKRSLFRRSST